MPSASNSAGRLPSGLGFLAPEKVDGILALIGGFCLHLTLGTLYCFGNLNTYMTSYLRKHVHPGIEYSDMIWVPCLATVSQGLFMTYSGHLEELVGIRWTIISGASIMSLGVILTSISIQYSVVATAITYGTMFGLGTALAYTPPLGVAMRWFPKSKGLVNGIIVGGFGLGAFIFNQIQTAYLNPTNKDLDDGQYFSDDKILNRVPSVFLMLGSVYTIVQFMSVLLIKGPPDDEVSAMMPLVTHSSPEETEGLIDVQDNNDDEQEEDEEDLELDQPLGSPRRSSIRVSQSELLESLKPGQIVKTCEFWILWSTFFLNTQAIGYINSMYKAYGQVFINDDHFLAVVGAFAAIFNASGRVFWGHLCDKFGYRSCMLVVTASMALLYLTFGFAPVYGGKVLFAVWVWAIFFFFCANFVLLPTATAQTFGTRHTSKNYGLVMTGQAAAAPVIAIITEFLSPALGWFGMFIIIAGASTLCCAITLKFPKNPSPKAIIERLQRPPPEQL